MLWSDGLSGCQILTVVKDMGVVVDGEVLITLDVLRVVMAFIQMEVDANHPPSGEVFDHLFVIHQLLVCDVPVDDKYIFPEWNERVLAFLPGLLGIEKLSPFLQGYDGLTISN